MISKILVAIHRNDGVNRQVFEEALDLAKATKASLKLLHVIAVDDHDSPGILALINTPENRHRWEEFEKPGLTLLRTLAEEAIAAQVPTEYAQILGRPSHLICETATAWNADLIMMGRRGISGMTELLLGSVSNYVSHYAPCSVMVVQGKSHEAKGAARPETVAATR
ncbi:MAG: universal stress protein [Leptolyngbya sp. Prado105]|jgi:nucleotide-binding universal stress UspA family protein|nr:universal stress protein [Leptolyngbya sp. Prado105]